MPSHIFTRVGYWKESIKSNAESARVAKLDGETHDQAHGMDYMVYAHLQLAQDKKARAVIDEMNKIEFKLDRFVGTYAIAASPARYVFERSDWKAAAELQVKSTKYFYPTRSPISRARSARPAPAIPAPPRPTSPSSPN